MIKTRNKYYKKMTSYNATGLAEGFIEPAGKTTKEKEAQVLAAWQYLVDTGMAWRLQGWFGRAANDLLEQGIINLPKNKNKKNTTDFYGNKINFNKYKK